MNVNASHEFVEGVTVPILHLCDKKPFVVYWLYLRLALITLLTVFEIFNILTLCFYQVFDSFKHSVGFMKNEVRRFMAEIK